MWRNRSYGLQSECLRGPSPFGGSPLWHILLYILIKQAVARAVPQQPAMDGRQACLHIPLRIQPPQLKAVSPKQGKKGDIVLLLHHVTAGDEQFVLHWLHGQAVGFIRLLGLQSRQGSRTGRPPPRL